jgi:hypothetical protein
VSEFAQFAESTGCGVSLKSVDRPPDTPHSLRIMRGFLQPQSVIVQRLEKVLRALKEEFA